MSAQPQVPQIATVRQIAGESTCFEVKSRTRPGLWHRVELKAHNGSGECACENWRTKSWPIIRDTKSLPPSKRCWHLRVARELYCSLKILAELAYE